MFVNKKPVYAMTLSEYLRDRFLSRVLIFPGAAQCGQVERSQLCLQPFLLVVKGCAGP